MNQTLDDVEFNISYALLGIAAFGIVANLIEVCLTLFTGLKQLSDSLLLTFLAGSNFIVLALEFTQRVVNINRRQRDAFSALTGSYDWGCKLYTHLTEVRSQCLTTKMLSKNV